MACNTIKLILAALNSMPCEFMIESVTGGEVEIALLYEEKKVKINICTCSDSDMHQATFSISAPLMNVDTQLYRALNSQRFVSISTGLSIFEHASELHFIYKLPEWTRDEDIGTACRHALEHLAFSFDFWKDIVYEQCCGESFAYDDSRVTAFGEKFKRRHAFLAAIRLLPTVDVNLESV